MKVLSASVKGNNLYTNPQHRLSAIGDIELRLPDHKRSYNRRLFAQVAPRYRLATRCLSFGRDSYWKSLLLERLAPPQSAQPLLIDLACGTGDIAIALARRHPHARVIGYDISEEMLGRARQRARGEKLDNLVFLNADMDDLPLTPESVDVVTGGYAIRNAPDLQTTLFEVYRVLRHGGQAAFLEFSNPPSCARRWLQLRLLRFWGQLWGLLLHGNPEVYAYIARSLNRFPDSAELDALMQRIGFCKRASRDLIAGFVRVTWLEKPPVS